jgi:hypothetical protein
MMPRLARGLYQLKATSNRDEEAAIASVRFAAHHLACRRDLTTSGGCLQRSRSHSVGEFELTLDCLKAQQVAQRVEKRIGLQILQTRIPYAQGRLQPVERFLILAPLCVDLGILIRSEIALRSDRARERGLRRRPLSELLVH